MAGLRFAFLGTSAALPSAHRDTTSVLFDAPGSTVLVDCGGSPVQRLRRLGVDPCALTRVLITHLHADHAYGLPSLVQGLVLLGRREPLEIRCCPEHVAPLRALLEIFGLIGREDHFAVTLAPMPPVLGAGGAGGLALRMVPNDHGRMPNYALRLEWAGRAVVYSSDTRPSEAVTDLARGSQTLIHEATVPERDIGRSGTHSSAADAGRVAARAGVDRLILTHVAAEYHDALPDLVEEARREFAGPVEVARELVWYAG